MTGLAQNAGKFRRADKVQRWSLLWSIFAFVMLALICCIGVWTLREVDNSDYWVDHTFTVISTSQQLMINLRDAEAATRAYILDPSHQNVSEFQSNSSGASSRSDALKSMTTDNARQQKRLGAFRSLLDERLKDFGEVISTRDRSGGAAAASMMRDYANQDLGQRIRDNARDFQIEEYGLLQQRSALRRTRTWQGLAGTLGAACFALIALIVAPIQVRRVVQQRDVANRQKQESDSMIQSLFDAAPQSIIIVDKRGSIVMANDETEKMFGYTPAELRQKPIEILLPDELQGDHVADRDRFFVNPQPLLMGSNLDMKARRQDGTAFPAEVSLSYIESERGTLSVAFVADISKRRADEQAIQEQREALRQLAGKLMTAQEDERRRIARNLHDDLNQDLACLSMDLGRLAANESFAEMSPQLRLLQKRAGDSADQVRKISHQLHPAILDDLGLRAALEDFCDEFQQRSGVLTHLSLRNVPGYLPAEVSSCIYRITGECLRNIAKHAQATSAYVDLELSGDDLRLSVRDDGIGFSKSASKTHAGIGVAAMKERVRLQGGTFAIQSGSTQGTRIDVEVPVNVS